MFLFFLFFLSVGVYSNYINLYFSPSREGEKQIDIALKEFVDSSNLGDTIYICAYQIDHSTIASSIDEAVRRGVKVYGIFDENTSLDIFKSNFERKKISSGKIMHNKFIILKSSKVWSGSYNFTVAATYKQDNFAVEIFSKELAEIYEKAFLYIWGENISLEDFNGKKVSLPDNTKITVYFNPFQSNPPLKDKVLDLLYDIHLEIPKVSSIYFAYTFFTLSEFVEIFKKMKNQMVVIEGVLDDEEENFYSYQALRNTEINVEFDKNLTVYGEGVMHNKFCILNIQQQDPFVICGSANLTYSGLMPEGNYENLMVIESKRICERFYKEFLYLKSKNFKIKEPPLLLTEVAINEPDGKDWIEIFVLENGRYGGWEILSGYPEYKIKKLPERLYYAGEFIIVNLNSVDIDEEKDNLVILHSSSNVNLYNTEGFLYIVDQYGNFIDAVGWSNRDGSISKNALLAYSKFKNSKMWKEGPQFENVVDEREIQNSLVDWSLHEKYNKCSIERVRNQQGLPNDTNSISDWFFSKNQTKGYGYKKIISFTHKILEIDKATNPFSPEDKNNNFVKINFNIPDEKAEKSIIVYDLAGYEIIKLLEKDKLHNGDYTTYRNITNGSITWDGKDMFGNYVKSGIYLVYMDAYNPQNANRYVSKDVVVVFRK